MSPIRAKPEIFSKATRGLTIQPYRDSHLSRRKPKKRQRVGMELCDTPAQTPTLQWGNVVLPYMDPLLMQGFSLMHNDGSGCYGAM